MAYTLNSSSYTAASLPNAIGQNYHLGLSDGTVFYGYMFQNTATTTQGIKESSNVTDKQSLITNSNTLVDRDLTFYPRVSQGDYSGGALQAILINQNRYLDSDMDATTPGYLTLRPQWLRKTITLATPTTNEAQIIGYPSTTASDLYVTFGESNGNVYLVNATTPLGAMTSSTPGAAAVLSLFTDGASLFAGTAANLYYNTPGFVAGWGAITSGINGTAYRWWECEQGTNGRFNYYAVRDSSAQKLYKVDMTATRPVAPAAQPQVPTGGMAIHIIDLCNSGTGIAILTGDSLANDGCDVWQHDGTNMTRMVRVEGYRGMGMCNCLGDLYVGAMDSQTAGGPVLIKISGGTFTIAVRPGTLGQYAFAQPVGAPVASGEWVYWPVKLQNTAVGGPGSQARILAYNSITGATMFEPFVEANDFAGSWNSTDPYLEPMRQVVGVGNVVACAFQNAAGTTGYVQFQQPMSQPGSSGITYNPTGLLVGSLVDFNTPGITKRFRRIEVHHAPLNAGEQIVVNGYVDSDPLKFNVTFSPVPSTATTSNAVVGSTGTTLTMGVSAIGRTLYYAVQARCGTGNLTTPAIYYVAIEVGGTWTWDVYFDCTNRRRTLNGQADEQGITGKDLYFLLRNAYENGNTLTLYLASGVNYKVNIESLDGSAISYVNQPNAGADQEWLAHVVMRQVL